MGQADALDVLGAPEHLTAAHDVTSFDCGVVDLNDWLKRRALQNEASRASRTFVVAAAKQVAGYYALAAGAVAHTEATGRVRRNMPDPIPVMVLARLAIDRPFQGKGLGAALLRDAMLRTLQASEIAGIRAVLLQAVSDDARRFYARFGFVESPVDPMIMMITLLDLEKAIR